MLREIAARARRELALRICPALGTELQQLGPELRELAREVAAQRAAAGIAKKVAQANEDLRARVAELDAEARQLRAGWQADREELEKRLDEVERLSRELEAAKRAAAPPVLGLPLCTCVTGRCSIHDAIAAPATPPVDRAPNIRRHDWDSWGMCKACGNGASTCSALPCPGPKGDAGA